MDMKPVNRYPDPRYPTRDILAQHPELLTALPERWRRNATLVTALTALCFLATTQRGHGDPPKQAPAMGSHVAPLFPHGDGQGSFGCVAVNPPVFLSEDEARQVVIEEGKRAGIVFVADIQTLEKVPLKGITGPEYSPASPKFPSLNLTLDGTQRERKIAYEYVSFDDARAWVNYDMRSTVSSYNMRMVASALRDGVATAKPDGYYGVFYDPMAGWLDPAYIGIVMADQTPLAPINFLVEWAGGRVERDWRAHTMTLTYGANTLVLKENNRTATLNGKPVTLAAPLLDHYPGQFAPLSILTEQLKLPMNHAVKDGKHHITNTKTGETLVLSVIGKASDGSIQLDLSQPRDNAQAKAFAKDQLRRQVKDFITWLKAEGVI